ncbi:MarR family winged helix-turn-helix transcriptional regulator [Fodinicola acaciae]|uniref:MarR family winged helix-turn-helix transcriptional regulator n=1 Tax=Fodinicola acaciae TaxID=2681555 RepID=UPI0013D1EFAC|nr:MarR family transcriptional regulator [Fodinicola acaciae]
MNRTHSEVAVSSGQALGRLFALSELIQQDEAAGMARLKLSRARAAVLWELHHQGPLTQRRLSDALNVTPRNITGLVDALELDGFVVRTKHPTDRRAILVRLTGHGAETTKKMAEGAGRFADQLFGSVPADELEAFVRTLDGVIERLRHVVESGDG